MPFEIRTSPSSQAWVKHHAAVLPPNAQNCSRSHVRRDFARAHGFQSWPLAPAGRVDVAAQERVVRVLAARLLPTVGDKDAARAAEILKDARDINPEIASIGVRQANGDMFASTQSHTQHWLNLPKDAMPRPSSSLTFSMGRRRGGGWKCASVSRQNR